MALLKQSQPRALSFMLKPRTIVTACRTGSKTQALGDRSKIKGKIKILPTIFRFDRLRVVIYPNDHRLAHVHVTGRGCEAVFNLHCPAGPVELRENYGFSRREIGRISSVLTNHLEELCSAWERIHEID